jgi:hypothetical protein
MYTETMDRFWNKVEKKEDGCWLWTGSKRAGYGRFRMGEKCIDAHRVSWSFINGEIPKGKVIMHKCDIPACVNPTHLQIGTQIENIKDCISKKRRDIDNGNHRNARKTHCKNGHEFTEENTYHRKKTNRRECRTCVLEKQKIARIKKAG